MYHTGSAGARGCGALLRRWRELRRLTQLDLALEADVSARHLSYVETGKTVPSRDMLALLAQVLDIPLRERNLLFLAAGYAPFYEEIPLDDARMDEARIALQLILKQHEPSSAFACDRYWNLVMANGAYVEFLNYTLGARAAALAPYVVLPSPQLNVLHLIFEPGPLRKVIVNWEEVAKAMLEQVQRVAAWTHDPLMHELIAALLTYPGVPQAWRVARRAASTAAALRIDGAGRGAQCAHVQHHHHLVRTAGHHPAGSAYRSLLSRRCRHRGTDFLSGLSGYTPSATPPSVMGVPRPAFLVANQGASPCVNAFSLARHSSPRPSSLPAPRRPLTKPPTA
jgi:transcriptional regulator with XRE-family HTH domain